MITPHPTMETRYVDGQLDILPWWTLPALQCLLTNADSLARKVVLEWGCGHSTEWFGKNTRAVYGIEHDARWRGGPLYVVDGVRDTVVEHVVVPGLEQGVDRQHEVSQEWCCPYVLKGWSCNPRTDLVVVDGLYRWACARLGAQIVVPGGCLVFDNAEWPEFAELPSMLRPRFRQHLRFIEPGRSWATDFYIGRLP